MPDNLEIAAVGAVCALLHVTFTILPLERIMTGLAYNTDLVPILWNFMKRCHESQRWPSLSELMACLSVDAPGWLLPLSVFSPVYRWVPYWSSVFSKSDMLIFEKRPVVSFVPFFGFKY